MKLLNWCGIASLLLAVGIAQAQGSTSTTSTSQKTSPASNAVLVADVNIASLQATTTQGIISGTFNIKSSLGSQENVIYGYAVIGTKSRMMLDTKTESEVLSLPEGVLVTKKFSYTLPTYMPENGDVYINFYNSRGLTLAVQKIGTVKKGTSVLACKSGVTVTCTSSQSGNLTVSVAQDSMLGKVVTTTTSQIQKNTAVSIDVRNVTKELRPGFYSITVTATDSNSNVVVKYIFTYLKEGAYAKIVSISPQATIKDGKGLLDVTVYALLNQVTTSTVPMVSLTTSCGTSQPILLQGSVVHVLASITCDKGTVEVDLLDGTKKLDSMQGSFSLPQGQTLAASGNDTQQTSSSNKNMLYVVLGIILILIIGWIATKMGRRGVQVAIILISACSFLQVSKANAATYSYSQPLICQTADAENAAVTNACGFINGTVIMNSSVPVNTSSPLIITLDSGVAATSSGTYDNFLPGFSTTCSPYTPNCFTGYGGGDVTETPTRWWGNNGLIKNLQQNNYSYFGGNGQGSTPYGYTIGNTINTAFISAQTAGSKTLWFYLSPGGSYRNIVTCPDHTTHPCSYVDTYIAVPYTVTAPATVEIHFSH